MRHFLTIFFIISFISCTNEKSKAIDPPDLPPVNLDNSVSYDAIIKPSGMPSSHELNEKHFYSTIVLDNNQPFHSRFYAVEKGYKFSFDLTAVLNFLDSAIKTSTDAESSDRNYEQLLNLATQSLKESLLDSIAA
jgi:hypothetical protein